MKRARRWLSILWLAAVAAGVAPAASAAPLVAPLSDGTTLDLPPLDPSLPSPAAFLGRPLGTDVTSQDEILAYLRALAAASPRVTVFRYGSSYEDRPLVLVAVTGDGLHTRLEAVREQRPLLADPLGQPPEVLEAALEHTPAVVWLAYGIHGDEDSPPEVAMATAYLLAADLREATADLLEQAVVLIDPLENPDGRARHLAAIAHPERIRNSFAPEPAGEWPGGRGNHYGIDLNRDWAWGSQLETRQRLAAYQAWVPQVHVDHHEMTLQPEYFFPPPSEPVHPDIDRRTRRWLRTFGEENAAAFDRAGWRYYVARDFDLFYPGYGDSYPSLRGAVGMTFEAGGGNGSQIGVRMPLADRIARHLTASLTVVGTAARNRRALLEDFLATRRDAAKRSPLSYLWAADQPEAETLRQILELHGIRVGWADAGSEVTARHLLGGPAPRRLLRPAYAADTAQPLGNLLRALMEPGASLPAKYVERQRSRIERHRPPEFFDITAWSLPLALNLDCWVATGVLGRSSPRPEPYGVRGAGGAGFLIPPQGVAGYRMATHLLRAGLRTRLVLQPLRVREGMLVPGSLYLPADGNPRDLPRRLQALAVSGRVRVSTVSEAPAEGWSGGPSLAPLRAVRVALAEGGGIDPTSFGFLWHLLQEGLGLPPEPVSLEELAQGRLSGIDVLLLPDGEGYRRRSSRHGAARLRSWIQDGGVVVAIGDAARWVAATGLSGARWRSGAESPEPDPAELFTPGAIVATEMLPSLLTLGVPASPPVLFWGSSYLAPSQDARHDLLRARDRPVVAGFAWPAAARRLAGSPLMVSEPLGRGRVVLFSQHPAFRRFWNGTTPLLLNAVLYAPSLPVTDVKRVPTTAR